MTEQMFTIFKGMAFFFSTAMLLKYFIFLMLAPFYSVKEARRKIKSQNLSQESRNANPLVSIIIPAWNEEVGILRTVISALENDYKNIEIVVINDGSTDNTLKLMRSFKKKELKKYPGRELTILTQKNMGKGPAMNHGLSKAKGDIILTVDADSFIETNAIGNLVNYFKDPEISGAVGHVKVAGNNSLLGLLQQLEYKFGFYFKRAHAVLGAEYIFGGACAAFRRELFEELGYFDEENKTEDIEYSMRVRYFGGKCTYMEDVVCYTEGASTIKGLLDQRLRWKKGRFDTFIKYRTLFFSLDSKHNKPLSWFVLPFAMLSEFQLLIEPIAISLLLTYSIISGDFISLTIGLGFVFLLYLVTSIFTTEKPDIKTLILFPFTWMMMYFLIWIEFLALLKSIKMVYEGENIKWQNWQREGIDKLSNY